MRFLRRGESASTLDLLVAGLGNPGREHVRDRHNAGWMVADELARRHGGSFRSKFSGRLAEVRLGEARLALRRSEATGALLAAAGREPYLKPAWSFCRASLPGQRRSNGTSENAPATVSF